MTVTVGGFLIVALLFLWRFCRCVHPWEFVDKTELPSRLEEMVKAGESPMWSDDLMRASKRWVIIVIRCPKCGAAKVMRESN